MAMIVRRRNRSPHPLAAIANSVDGPQGRAAAKPVIGQPRWLPCDDAARSD
jgi:hypothetical protein